MTTTLTPTDRAAKAQETVRRKQADHNAGAFPQAAFVKITSGHEAYRGRIGKVHSHNDLRTEALPNLTVEIGVVFTGGGGQIPIWFTADQLERTSRPANWV